MKFKKINDRTYEACELDEIRKVINDFVRISSGGSLNDNLIDQPIREMLAYHVANVAFKGGIDTNVGVGIVKIIVKATEINVDRKLLNKDVIITITQLGPYDKETKLRFYGVS